MIVDLSEILTKLGLGSGVTNQQLGLLNMVHAECEQAIKDICGIQIEQATYTAILPATPALRPRDQFLDPIETVNGRAVVSYGHFTTGNILKLPETPVRSITAVYEDRLAFGGQFPGAFASGTLLTQGIDYWLDYEYVGFSQTGHLKRIVGAWPGIERTVKVIYVAGYSPAELNGDPAALPVTALPIKEAVLSSVVLSYNASLNLQEGEPGTITRKRLGDKNESYNVSESGLRIIIPKSARQRLRRYISYSRFLGGY